MVINIPSESEASDATVISGCLIDEEVETQSAEVPQLQQPPEIDTMARTRKPQTIPTPSLHPMMSPVQGIPVIPGESSARPWLRQKKRKVPDTPGEWGKTPAADQGNDDEEEELLPQADPQIEWADPNFPAYIRPRILGAVHAYLLAKPVTTLITPRIPIDIPILKDILPTLAFLKLQGYDIW